MGREGKHGNEPAAAAAAAAVPPPRHTHGGAPSAQHPPALRTAPPAFTPPLPFAGRNRRRVASGGWWAAGLIAGRLGRRWAAQNFVRKCNPAIEAVELKPRTDHFFVDKRASNLEEAHRRRYIAAERAGVQVEDPNDYPPGPGSYEVSDLFVRELPPWRDPTEDEEPLEPWQEGYDEQQARAARAQRQRQAAVQREGSAVFAGPSREAQKVRHCRAAHSTAVGVAAGVADRRRQQNWTFRDDRKDWNKPGGRHGLATSWAGSIAEKYDRGTVGRSAYVSSGMAVLDHPQMWRSTATSAAMLRAVARQQQQNMATMHSAGYSGGIPYEDAAEATQAVAALAAFYDRPQGAGADKKKRKQKAAVSRLSVPLERHKYKPRDDDDDGGAPSPPRGKPPPMKSCGRRARMVAKAGA